MIISHSYGMIYEKLAVMFETLYIIYYQSVKIVEYRRVHFN